MKTYRRRRQQYIFAAVLGVIAVVNILFFLILYRPARVEYVRLQESIEKSRTEIQARQLKISRLEKLSTQLSTFEQDKSQLRMHFIPRSSGWSEIVPQLTAMVQKAGVRNTRKEFSLQESAPQYGLYSVETKLPVTGVYSNVVKLIQQIETSETFFIINSIDVRGSSTPGADDVTMILNLETFFYE